MKNRKAKFSKVSSPISDNGKKHKAAIPKALTGFIHFHTEHLIDCLVLEHFFVFTGFEKKLKCPMSVCVNYPYFTAIIHWGDEILRAWKNNEREQIVRWLCHELCHIITGENGDLKTVRKCRTRSEYFDERINEQVSRLAFRLYCRWVVEQKLDIPEYSFAGN